MSFVIVPYFIFLYSILHFIHHLYIKRNRTSDEEEEVTSDIGEEIQEQSSKRRYGHNNNTSTIFFLVSYIHMQTHNPYANQLVLCMSNYFFCHICLIYNVEMFCIEQPGQAKKQLAVRHRKHRKNNSLQGNYS